MKEKLGVAMAFSISIMIVVLLIIIFYPQLNISSAEKIGFIKGTCASLISCLISLFAVFKYDKRNNIKTKV